jgi:hypothetical protein
MQPVHSTVLVNALKTDRRRALVCVQIRTCSPLAPIGRPSRDHINYQEQQLHTQQSTDILGQHEATTEYHGTTSVREGLITTVFEMCL